MKRTICLSLALIILLVGSILAPNLSAENIKTQQKNGLRFFTFNTTTEIELLNTSELNNPILPNTTIELGVKIKFKFETPSLFPVFLIDTKIGRWIMFRDTKYNMTVDIKLQQDKTPSWCILKLDKDKITIENISTDYQEKTTKLTITIKENAKALETGKIKIQANFTPESKWGLTPSGNKIEKTITVAYQDNIETSVENQTIKITPTKTTYIPIKITNKGNGKTTVKTEIKNIPENWSISFNETNITLDINEEKQLHLNVTSIKNFDNETITIQFTPVLTENNSYKGETKTLEITLQNDGSLKEEKILQIDTTTLVIMLIVLIAVILVLIVIVFFIKKR